MSVVVQLTLPNGSVESKQLASGYDVAVEGIGPLFQGATGRFVVRTSMVSNHTTLASEMVGELQAGKIEGPVYTYIVGKDIRDVISKVNFIGNKRDGHAQTFYSPSGVIQFDMNFRNGVRDGWFTAYYPSSHVLARAFYKDGKLNGPCTTFEDNGNMISKGTYDKGVPGQGTFVLDFEHFVITTAKERPTDVVVIGRGPREERKRKTLTINR